MSRSQRHSKILEIIASADVETQEDLVYALERSGFPTTQATISRDIKDLGLIKTLSDRGVYKYSCIKTSDSRVSNKLLNIFREAVVSIVTANNIVVIKTLGGLANAVLTVVKQLGFSESLGNVASDDTLIMVCADDEKALELKEKIEKNLFE